MSADDNVNDVLEQLNGQVLEMITRMWTMEGNLVFVIIRTLTLN